MRASTERCSPYDPEFRLIERVKPFIDRAMRERYQPVETARRAQQTLSDLFGLVTSMPRDLARLVKDARHGRLRVDLTSSVSTASAIASTAQWIGQPSGS